MDCDHGVRGCHDADVACETCHGICKKFPQHPMKCCCSCSLQFFEFNRFLSVFEGANLFKKPLHQEELMISISVKQKRNVVQLLFLIAETCLCIDFVSWQHLTPQLLSHPKSWTSCKSSQVMSPKRHRISCDQVVHDNITKRWIFWNLNYPFGIANINREDLIDMDEAAVFVESVNRKHGKTRIGRRCREAGNYGHSEKYTTTMAISADPNDGMRHCLFEQKAGTTIADFAQFIQQILNIIGQGTPARRRCFIMDNLTSHHSAIIRQMITDAGHRIVFRAPYYPVDGPIEFVFNHVEEQLTGYQYLIENGEDLRDAVIAIVTRIQHFQEYFIHCGY